MAKRVITGTVRTKSEVKKLANLLSHYNVDLETLMGNVLFAFADPEVVIRELPAEWYQALLEVMIDRKKEEDEKKAAEEILCAWCEEVVRKKDFARCEGCNDPVHEDCVDSHKENCDEYTDFLNADEEEDE